RRKKSGRIKTPKESNEVCHRVGGVDGSREGETIAPLHQAAPHCRDSDGFRGFGRQYSVAGGSAGVRGAGGGDASTGAEEGSP
ncbi:unnamed protein product, partial [Ascophyllum nodosum]